MLKPCLIRHFKISPAIIRLAGTLCIWFSLALRNVADLLDERRHEVGRETIRSEWNCFRIVFAAKIRSYRIAALRLNRSQWHLEGTFAKINVERRYLWQWAKHEGEVPESKDMTACDKKAALKLSR